MFSIARKSELVWNPWKNGAGLMADAAMSQERSATGDPVWRVSMAKVERDSAFSNFPGVDRGMMLIEGARIDLHVESSPTLTVRASGPAVWFPGDRPTRGVPVGGAIVNLNVMVRRDVLRQRMIGWECDGTAWLPVMPGGRSFAYVLHGQIAVLGDEANSLRQGDTLMTDATAPLIGTARLIEIGIWPT